MQVEKLKTIDADTLLSTPMRKTLFVVDGLIPQGLSVLSGSSKIGKSWLMLWLGIQVARGQPVWEFETHKSDVLYLCLEDTYARILCFIGMGFKPHRHAALFLSSPFPLLQRSGKDEQ